MKSNFGVFSGIGIVYKSEDVVLSRVPSVTRTRSFSILYYVENSFCKSSKMYFELNKKETLMVFAILPMENTRSNATSACRKGTYSIKTQKIY